MDIDWCVGTAPLKGKSTAADASVVDVRGKSGDNEGCVCARVLIACGVLTARGRTCQLPATRAASNTST